MDSFIYGFGSDSKCYCWPVENMFIWAPCFPDPTRLNVIWMEWVFRASEGMSCGHRNCDELTWIHQSWLISIAAALSACKCFPCSTLVHLLHVKARFGSPAHPGVFIFRCWLFPVLVCHGLWVGATCFALTVLYLLDLYVLIQSRWAYKMVGGELTPI